jgi:hypothetical protein
LVGVKALQPDAAPGVAPLAQQTAALQRRVHVMMAGLLLALGCGVAALGLALPGEIRVRLQTAHLRDEQTSHRGNQSLVTAGEENPGAVCRTS